MPYDPLKLRGEAEDRLKVKNWMVKNPVTIHPQNSLQDAIDLMQRHAIRHLPVMEDDDLVGFITESNIRQYFIHVLHKELLIKDVMIVNPITIDVNASIDTAARLIHQYKIGGLPVLEKRRLVGIFTTTDIVAAFIEILGLLQKSARIDIMLSEKGGTLDDVLRLIRENGLEILSVVTERPHPKRKIHCIRLEKGNLGPVMDLLEAHGHKVVSVLD